MPASIFRHSHRVTYGDCTVGNHVYYSRYLHWLEAARGEFFRSLGTTLREWHDREALFPVTEIHFRYKFPARYDDVLSIELWISEMSGARLGFGCRILNQNNSTLVEGETRHVCAGLNEKPKRLPVELVAALQPYLNAKPATPH